VLFSSVASLLGSPGQANYAAVNAGLDAAAAAGQMSGVPVVSVQWGAWAGGGMAAADVQTAARVERMGMSLISPAAGLAALQAAMCTMSQLSSVSSKSLSLQLFPQWYGRGLCTDGCRESADISMFAEFTPTIDVAAEAVAGTTPLPSGFVLQAPVMY